MQDYKAFLKANPVGVLATATDNQPHTRVFQYLWNEDDKAFFCTGKSKDVYRELAANPRVSFCTWDPKSFATLRISGSVQFMDDMERKERVLAENPPIKGIYKNASNPEFMLFSIAIEEVGTFNFRDGTHNTHI